MTLLPMPKMSKSNDPGQGTTPVPNFLLDQVMPRLRDTEWRLLCIIVRQTSGWVLGDGTRKKADWLSHFQLKRKTGRSSAAISKAIDGLVRSGLIIVRDLSGQPLTSPRDRRQSHSRLSFSLNHDLASTRFQEQFSHARFQISKRRNNKRKLYKRKQQQHSLFERLHAIGPREQGRNLGK